jgi:hypothetical protein
MSVRTDDPTGTTACQSTSATDHPAPAARLARVHATAWQPSAELPYHDWVIEGRRIGTLYRSSPWWIGDWLLYGTSRWGEMYAKAARITGYDRKSLRNMRYVSSRVRLSLRRDNLTWSHHALLASAEPAEQRQWLERACAERLSVEDLRVELRSARKEPIGVTPAIRAPRRDRHGAVIACPNCGESIPLAAQLADVGGAARRVAHAGDAR